MNPPDKKFEIQKRITNRAGGLAAWSVRHPVGVSMISLAVIVLGIFALGRLAIDLLPHIIYPDIRVRILDPGVPATVMEDRVTRQLEEQLAITEDAVSVQSTTSQGLTTVDLSFEYGKDIDIALRDASTRLDRAKRFLPETINPPIIYKLDPSQISVLEMVVSSSLLDPVELRTWTDDIFRKWFLTLPGVAAAEVGGGLIREIHILPDQQRLAGVGLSMRDIINALQRGNREDPAGRLDMSRQQITGKISGRFESVEEIANLPIRLSNGNTIYLDEIATVIDSHEDERLRVRANGIQGVKLSIQKQPTANTVAVVEEVQKRLRWLKSQTLIPDDININVVSDQSIYVRQSLNNSTLATLSGALLAMAVVYIFLGNLKRTLIIGSAIPIAIMVTFVLMGAGGLTLNVMTLGGLALGVGMLVDNTIVMLENIYRHQQIDETPEIAAEQAAKEVNSAIIAATSTNLAAVLPFLFIGGLIGLLFRELIFTISAAILASMIIALTLVPALAAKVHRTKENRFRTYVDNFVFWLQGKYILAVSWSLKHPVNLPVILIAMLAWAIMAFVDAKVEFLPKMDDGRITVRINSDPGITLNEMDKTISEIERLFYDQPETETVFTLVGGSVFGRTQREIPNQTTIIVQLVPLSKRSASSGDWIKRLNKLIADKGFAGIKIRMRQRGIRGIRTSRGDDDISLRIQGPDMKELEDIADSVIIKLKQVSGLKNISHSSEEEHFELSIKIDRDRASALGYDVEDISLAMQIALDGIVVTDFIEGDRSYDVRLRLPKTEAADPQDLESVVLFPATQNRTPVYLGNVASINLVESPATIERDNQLRIVEIEGSIEEDATLGDVISQLDQILSDLKLPEGYFIYEGGSKQALQEGEQLFLTLLMLALFLVFVVMAVQYESLLNPLVIMLSVPFAGIGVALGMVVVDLTLSMPLRLGMIMLAGIVVNNAIVLVEYIEIMRENGLDNFDAIVEAARIRLRPILMTTLTTVVGMLPLALGFGEGAEMLQPLAVTIVWGLSFSMLVSLLLVPIIYSVLHGGARYSKSTMSKQLSS